MNCIKCCAELPEGALFCPACGKKQVAAPRKYRKRANGTGTVYNLGDGRSKPWAARKNGKLIGTYPTKKDAQEALERLSGRTLSETYNLTFAEVYERWKVSHFPDIGETAVAQYEISFKIFTDLHKRRFRDLRTPDYQEVLDRHAGKSENTVGKYKQLITQMSTWAIENELITVNFASFAVARGRQAKAHEAFTPEEIAKILADGSEAARVVSMLFSTGMRIGELFALRLDDYHETYCIGGEKTDEGRDRVIPIRAEGREHFEYFAARARAKSGSRLIDGYSGNRTAANFRKRDYHALLERLGIDSGKTPHSTRTTYGTRAATEEALPAAVLQKVLGHKQFNTTQKYYNRPDAEQLVKAVEKAQGEK